MATLEQRFDSLMARVRDLEVELAREKQKNFLLECEHRQWAADKALQQQIIQQTINNTNAKNGEYLEEIKQLKQRLADLRQFADLE